MNKYCICYNIEDDIEDNLFYIKGIIHSLCFCDRDYDIYVDLSQKSYDILSKIIKTENLFTDNLYFNIHSDYVNKKIWYINTMLNNAHLYEIIGIKKCSCECGENELSKINDKQYSLYTYLQTIENNISYCWKYIDYFGDTLYLKYSKLDKEYFNKIKNMFKKLYELNIPKENLFKDMMLNTLFLNEIYNNNVLYLCNTKEFNNDYISSYTNTYFYNDIKWYWLKINIRKSNNFKDNFYYLNDKKYIYDYIEPQEKYTVKNTDYYNTFLKHMFLQVERFIFYKLSDIDLNIYENDIKQIESCK